MSAPTATATMTAAELLHALMVNQAFARRHGARVSASDLLVDAYEIVYAIRDRDDAIERCGEDLQELIINLFG